MNARPRTTGAQNPDDDSIAQLVERAFHYRGDVTVQTDDGNSVTGYLFNRNAQADEPFAQLYAADTGDEVSLLYRNITRLLFTGSDAAAAADERFETFQRRRDEQAPLRPHPAAAERHDA